MALLNIALTPLFILAALATDLLALKRAEEPQMIMPLVEIHLPAQGLKAENGVRLATGLLEVIVKAINEVNYVGSSTRDDNAIVAAHFAVGTTADPIHVLIGGGPIRYKPILLTAIATMMGAVVFLSDPIFPGLAIFVLVELLSCFLLTVLVIPATNRVFKT